MQPDFATLKPVGEQPDFATLKPVEVETPTSMSEIPKKSIGQRVATGLDIVFGGGRVGEAIGAKIAQGALGEKLAKAISGIDLTPEERATIQMPSGKEILGSALQSALIFTPVGKIATGVRTVAPFLGKVGANIVAGGATGYGFDVAMNMQENKPLFSPSYGTIIGAGIPAVAPFAKGTVRLGGEVLGVSTGTGYGVVREALEATSAGGKRAEVFTEALRGRTSPEAIVDEARTALDTILTSRRQNYTDQLSIIARDTKKLDISPIIREVGKQLDNFNIARLENGGLDFSRSTIRFDKEAQKTVQTIVDEMSGYGLRKGDRTPLAVDKLKQSFDDLYSPSSQVRSFVSAIRKETRKALSPVQGYDELVNKYAEQTALIKEIKSGLSLKDTTQVDTAFRKLTSALRVNNEFRKELVQELDNASGGYLSSKIAGQQLSELFPRGLARPLSGIGVGVGLVQGIGALSLLKVAALTSPRLVGELLNVLGISKKYAGGLLESIEKNIGKLKSPGDALLDRASTIPNKQGGFVRNPFVTNIRNQFGVKSSSNIYRQGGQFKQWTDFRTVGNVQKELRSLDDVKAQITDDLKDNPNFEFKYIKNKDGTYTILYKEGLFGEPEN